jgi:hypothetical protein
LILNGLVVAFALPAYAIAHRVGVYGWEYYGRVGPAYWLFPDIVDWQAREGEYFVRIVHDRRYGFDGARYEDRHVEILRGGQVMWSAADWHIEPSIGDPTRLPPVADLDGDGTPEFICTSSAGGNSGASKTYVVRLGEDGITDFCPHADGHYDNICEVRDIDGDGRLDFVALDHTFVFAFGACHTASPYPRIAYRIRDRKLVVAPELMRLLPRPTAQAIDEALDDCRKTNPSVRAAAVDRFQPMLGVMLDLIYTGRASDAYSLLDRAPGSADEKRAFAVALNAELAHSPFRDAIEALGHPTLPETTK